MDIFQILVFIAVAGIPLGKVAQVIHTYKHKEVRDISAFDLIFMVYSYIILAIEAFNIGSDAFFYKNAVVLVPVSILVWMKWAYKDREWHDDDDKNCGGCNNEMEPHWTFCPDCGSKNLYDNKAKRESIQLRKVRVNSSRV